MELSVQGSGGGGQDLAFAVRLVADPAAAARGIGRVRLADVGGVAEVLGNVAHGLGGAGELGGALVRPASKSRRAARYSSPAASR